MKPSKFARCFLFVAGVLLLATASAKLISSFGSAGILQNSDPIIGLTFRNEFRLVRAVELVIALLCLFGKGTLLSGLVFGDSDFAIVKTG